jgi:ribosomal protein L37AE/L43A
VKGSAPASRPDTIICPLCEAGELFSGGVWVRCDSCARAVEAAILRTLEQIASLADAVGEHACECGHPEMRRLPDAVFHCPACGLEVIPLEHLRASKSGELSCKEHIFRKGEHLPTPS